MRRWPSWRRSTSDFKESVQRRDIDTIFALNSEFHRMIYRHGDNEEALLIYERYATLLGGLRGKYGYSEVRLDRMVDEHTLILQALRDQDEDRLEKVVRAHVEGAKTDLLERMGGK